jgi:DNA repair protein REV1
LGEFYNNSRLHHISTMGASFKAYVADLRNKNPERKFPARENLKKLQVFEVCQT